MQNKKEVKIEPRTKTKIGDTTTENILIFPEYEVYVEWQYNFQR